MTLAPTVASPSGDQARRNIQVFPPDPEGIDTVTFSLSEEVVTMTFNATTGYYEDLLHSRQLADEGYQGTVTAMDKNGRITSVMIDVQVANTVPAERPPGNPPTERAIVAHPCSRGHVRLGSPSLHRQRWKKARKAKKD